jgi:hypothetical protein
VHLEGFEHSLSNDEEIAVNLHLFIAALEGPAGGKPCRVSVRHNEAKCRLEVELQEMLARASAAPGPGAGNGGGGGHGGGGGPLSYPGTATQGGTSALVSASSGGGAGAVGSGNGNASGPSPSSVPAEWGSVDYRYHLPTLEAEEGQAPLPRGPAAKANLRWQSLRAAVDEAEGWGAHTVEIALAAAHPRLVFRASGTDISAEVLE